MDIDDLKKLHENKTASYVRSGAYAVLTYAVYGVLLFLINLALSAIYGGQNLVIYGLEVATAIFFLNSMLLIFFTYDRATREEFLKHNSEATFKPKEAWKGALRDKHFWLRMAVMWGLYLILPTVGFSSIPTFITSLFWLDPLPPLACRLIGVAVFLPVSLGLSLFVYGDVRKMWIELPRRLFHIRKSAEKQVEKTYRLTTMLWRVAYTTGLTFLAALIAPLLLGVVVTAFGVALLLARIKWTWIILGVVAGVTYYLCIRTRFRFLRRLKKCCKKNGFELVAKKHPYRSIIRDGGGYNLVVKANGKTYYCRFLASVRKSNKIYLRTDGICERARLVRFPVIRVIQRHGFVMVNPLDMDEGREMFRMVSTFDYRFEAEGEKILLFNPVPKFLFRKAENGSFGHMDNGDTIGEYTVFSGNAFLRSLERECV